MRGRRAFLQGSIALAAAGWLSACADDGDRAEPGSSPADRPGPSGLWMPAEEARHEATWMCLPARREIWGADLAEVQATIAEIALTIADYEAVRLLVRPEDRDRALDLVGSAVELVEAPVDDLWARDTLPLFLVSDSGTLAAGQVQFNGWGDKQVHDGDATLVDVVADHLGIEVVESGLVGEGGGLENDGEGTLLAARSSWVNDNRNPGLGEDQIAQALVETLGAERLLWVDGLAGQDITDGHIDTLARFTDPATIVHEYPSYVEPGEQWYDLAVRTEEELAAFATTAGDPYDLVALQQPSRIPSSSPDFLASYVNYYVCNGAVVVPEFGDPEADGLAAEVIGAQYPDREVASLRIDAVALGGGGIHCATQQQPSLG